ncbi:N-acyl-D-amino-acid deacylase family protein [Steroidobacter sp.]|uniref:N-acyl-D-amino-acid deacylase family protein n=1 Tax=Steroidobacter sp. TaxID=1978227 RepID=UPI001A543831|nr:D-aminoacylase [Steroidobacter sp.]MBL8271092.1 D-aminoacylase [Steroidobacter sp.]
MKINRIVSSALKLVLATALLASSVQAKEASSSVLITNAMLVDGTGAKAQPSAAVRIEGDRIVAVGKLKPKKGEQVVDAHGLVLAPGFIDTHSHHDRGVSKHRTVEPAVSQGVTTIIVGQDGGSSIPVDTLFKELDAEPIAVNTASYIGHGSVRKQVMGDDFKRVATAAEVDRMRELVAASMKLGALGLSTGLEYDPGIYADRSEVVALTAEAAKFGGRYISHMRSEDRDVWKALEEVIELGRVTGAHVQVSHMKLAMTDWWGQADRFINMMDRARAEGVKITGDVYPYDFWHSWLSVLFPERDFDNRATVDFVLRSLAPPDGITITGNKADPSVVGKTVAQIATERNVEPAVVVMDLLREMQKVKSEVSVNGTSMREDDVAKFIAWPHNNICSDGSIGGAHPRGAGAFTRVLRMYVREQKLLTLEQAIHKMSGLAAEHVGLEGRGVIKAGAFADLVLLDPATVTDRATRAEPGALSVGIERVWVNGQPVFEQGHSNGKFPGKPIRRDPTPTKS